MKNSGSESRLSKELLGILCCPQCRGELTVAPEKQTLTCRECRRVYRVEDDIPVLLTTNQTDQTV